MEGERVEKNGGGGEVVGAPEVLGLRPLGEALEDSVGFRLEEEVEGVGVLPKGDVGEGH